MPSTVVLRLALSREGCSRVRRCLCSPSCNWANGNSLNDAFRTYTWDADGNSVTIGSVTLTYDVLDRMVEQTTGSTNSEIVYGPGGDKLP